MMKQGQTRQYCNLVIDRPNLYIYTYIIMYVQFAVIAVYILIAKYDVLCFYYGVVIIIFYYKYIVYFIQQRIFK